MLKLNCVSGIILKTEEPNACQEFSLLAFPDYLYLFEF